VGVTVLTASRDFVLGDGQRSAPEELQAALGPRYSLVKDGRSRTLRRTWLDTFDWRLHRAGLTLELVTGRGPGRLVLTCAVGERITGPANGVRWPALATDLPPGPLRDRLEEVTRERALLPAARVVSHVASLRACNGDDKTVARLTVDTSAATTPAPAKLPARLSVAPVRGYQAHADRIARLLTEVNGVEPVAERQLDAALAVGGRRPGDYTGKVDVALTAGMPARLAMRAVLLRLLGTLEANVAGTVRDTDTEFLHDLRVAVRRTRSALKLAGDVLPGRLAAEFAPEFKWLGAATTPTRDLDVYLLLYPKMAASLSSTKPAELVPFHDYLVQRRAQEQRRLVRTLRSRRFTGLTANWRDAVTGLTAPRRGPTAGDLAARVLRKADRRVLKLGSSINDVSPAEQLHDLRKRCKELRYALEFFASLADPGSYRQALRDLKDLQDCLGSFQDCQVQQHEIREIAAEMMAEHDATAVTLLAMGDLAAQIGRTERRARREFAGRFTEFAGQVNQRRFDALIRGATASDNAAKSTA
jgi:CHAD domain-containing protein